MVAATLLTRAREVTDILILLPNVFEFFARRSRCVSTPQQGNETLGELN